MQYWIELYFHVFIYVLNLLSNWELVLSLCATILLPLQLYVPDVYLSKCLLFMSKDRTKCICFCNLNNTEWTIFFLVISESSTLIVNTNQITILLLSISSDLRMYMCVTFIYSILLKAWLSLYLCWLKLWHNKHWSIDFSFTNRIYVS